MVPRSSVIWVFLRRRIFRIDVHYYYRCPTYSPCWVVLYFTILFPHNVVLASVPLIHY